jgi:hypothetical protein
MKIIALDISTKTGYAIFEDSKLAKYGQLKQTANNSYKDISTSIYHRAQETFISETC